MRWHLTMKDVRFPALHHLVYTPRVFNISAEEMLGQDNFWYLRRTGSKYYLGCNDGAPISDAEWCMVASPGKYDVPLVCCSNCDEKGVVLDRHMVRIDLGHSGATQMGYHADKYVSASGKKTAGRRLTLNLSAMVDLTAPGILSLIFRYQEERQFAPSDGEDYLVAEYLQFVRALTAFQKTVSEEMPAVLIESVHRLGISRVAAHLDNLRMAGVRNIPAMPSSRLDLDLGEEWHTKVLFALLKKLSAEKCSLIQELFQNPDNGPFLKEMASARVRVIATNCLPGEAPVLEKVTAKICTHAPLAQRAKAGAAFFKQLLGEVPKAMTVDTCGAEELVEFPLGAINDRHAAFCNPTRLREFDHLLVKLLGYVGLYHILGQGARGILQAFVETGLYSGYINELTENPEFDRSQLS